ncbi:hypothetical protein MD484_g1658, partial [Candolleomyces efflorescens]
MAGPPSGSQGTQQLVPSTNAHRSYYLISFWLESTIYGMYFFLFAGTVLIFRRKKATDRSASIITMVGNSLMFGLSTFHNGVIVYQMVAAYALQKDSSLIAPVDYLRNFDNWSVYAYAIVLPLVTWTGDILVIYRCWIVWQRNNWVLLVPCILLLASFATSSINVWWFRHKDSISRVVMKHLFRTTFPLNVAQNVITTGLISYRIWKQHRMSQQVGVQLVSSSLTLYTVLRIIIESASIYTFEQVLMIILFFTTHPAIVIVQHASIPSTGIVFVLIAVRTHVAKHNIETTRFSRSVFPVWLAEDEESDRSHHERSSAAPLTISSAVDHRLELSTPNRDSASGQAKIASSQV